MSSAEFKPQIQFEDATAQQAWGIITPRVRLGILLESRRKVGSGQTIQFEDTDGAGQQQPLTLSASQLRESPVFVMHWWQAGHRLGRLPTPPPVVSGQEAAVLATQGWWKQRKAGKQPQNTCEESKRIPDPLPSRPVEAPITQTQPTQFGSLRGGLDPTSITDPTAVFDEPEQAVVPEQGSRYQTAAVMQAPRPVVRWDGMAYSLDEFVRIMDELITLQPSGRVIPRSQLYASVKPVLKRARQHLAQEQAARQRIESERVAREQVARWQAARQQAARERAERERAARESAAAENAAWALLRLKRGG